MDNDQLSLHSMASNASTNGYHGKNSEVWEALYAGHWEDFEQHLESLGPSEMQRLLLPDEAVAAAAARYESDGQQQPLSDISSSCSGPVNNLAKELALTPLFELLLSRQMKLIARAVQLLTAGSSATAASDGSTPHRAARFTLFQLVDFCRHRPDLELQLASSFEQLATEQPQFCAHLLSAEATSECLTPLEFAAVSQRFHLARVFVEAPGFLRDRRVLDIDPRLVVDRFDLTRYRWLTGDRFAKSPFVQLGCAVTRGLGDRIPDGHASFYDSPVVQGYVRSLRSVSVTLRATIVMIIAYLMFYPIYISTLTVNLFTVGRFRPDAVLRVAGESNGTTSYLTQLPQWLFAGMRYLLYARVAMQVCIISLMFFYFLVTFLANRCLLKLSRRNWLVLHWIRSSLTFHNDIRDGLCLGVILGLLLSLLMEFECLGSNYTVMNDQTLVDPLKLKSFFMLHLTFQILLMLLLADELSDYIPLFFYLLHSLQESMKIIYTIVFPVVLFCITLAVCHPYSIPTSEGFVEKLIDMLAGACRFVFALTDFDGPSNYLLVWGQPAFYIVNAVFLVNFCIALLTQRITVMEQLTEMRQTIRYVHMNHQFMLAAARIIACFASPENKPLILEMVHLRSDISMPLREQ